MGPEMVTCSDDDWVAKTFVDSQPVIIIFDRHKDCGNSNATRRIPSSFQRMQSGFLLR
jgi:hypothetical protein